MPPAAAVHHLLVGQHGGALRAPVHLALLAVDQPFLVHAQKEPLVPAVVLGQAGGDFGGPVVAQAQAQHLPLHGGDVAERPLARRRIVLERGVFGGQPEGVPAHGVQHVVAAHPHLPRQRVADGVVAHVSHVQLAAGIRQHLQHVVLGLICLWPAQRRRAWDQRPNAPATSVRLLPGRNAVLYLPPSLFKCKWARRLWRLERFAAFSFAPFSQPRRFVYCLNCYTQAHENPLVVSAAARFGDSGGPAPNFRSPGQGRAEVPAHCGGCRKQRADRLDRRIHRDLYR